MVFINDILEYSKDKEEHAQHLRVVLRTLREHQFYAKLKEYEFWLEKVVFRGMLSQRKERRWYMENKDNHGII